MMIVLAVAVVHVDAPQRVSFGNSAISCVLDDIPYDIEHVLRYMSAKNTA